MRIDRPDDGDTAPGRAGRAGIARPHDEVLPHDDTRPPDGTRPREAAAGGADPVGSRETPPSSGDAATRAERSQEHEAKVEATNRAYAIDQAYERVTEIERGTVTPAMRRLEAEDPSRHLAGLENRLKGEDRLGEKVSQAMTERGRTFTEALTSVKDAIRYTLCYPHDQYTEGVYADCDRLAGSGFERVERRNSWTHEEYKGINSRWRVPDSGQLFEVQFHTQASYEAKQETHWAYEKLRDPATSKAEQEALSAYQCKVTARIPIPPGAAAIPDYRYS